jgi:hypothetical protein
MTQRIALIEEAIQAGKFPESRRAHYEHRYRRDPIGTSRIVASLAAVGRERLAAEPEPISHRGLTWDRTRVGPGPLAAPAPAAAPFGDGLPKEWFPESTKGSVRPG